MGIFTHYKEQDARLDALEQHVRQISEALQRSQIDLARQEIMVWSLQSQVEQKVSTEDVDPAIVTLNQELDEARVEYEKLSSAAADSWSTLYSAVSESVSNIRAKVEKASSGE